MEETAKTIIDLEETNESDFSLDHRRPERLLHFSDGTLGVDEYEDKPVDDPDKPQSVRQLLLPTTVGGFVKSLNDCVLHL